MSIWKRKATNGGGSSEIPPEGNHLASCIAMIDLGTHNETFNGKSTLNRKLLICWELATEFDSAGDAFIVGFDFNVPETLSSKSKLRSLIEKWRGRPLGEDEEFDLTKLLGKGCLINLGHALSAKDRTYCKLLGISPTIKGMSAPEPHHRPFIWGFESDEPSQVPGWIPWLYGRSIQDWIDAAQESRPRPVNKVPVGLASRTEGVIKDPENDPIPF